MPVLSTPRPAAVSAISLLAIASVLSACGSTDEKLTFGAPNTAGPAISMPVDSPAPCTLLSDTDITAILPQATAITSSAKAVTFLPEAPRLDGPTPAMTMRGAQCTYQFSLPYKDGRTDTQTLQVELLSDPDPASITAQFEQYREMYPAATPTDPSWGTEPCVKNTSIGDSIEVVCHRGHYYFAVTGFANRSDVTPETWTDRVIKPAIATIAAKLPR